MKCLMASIFWLCSASCLVASEASSSSTSTAVSQKVFDQNQGILEASLINFTGKIRYASQRCPVFTADSVTLSTRPDELQAEAAQVDALISQLRDYKTTLKQLAFMHTLKQRTQASQDQSKL